MDLDDVLQAARVPSEIFSDPENRIDYLSLAHLLLESARQSRCEHIALLVTERTRIEDFGLAGRLALLGKTAGEAMLNFARHFNLHNSAAILSVITTGAFTRIVYTIVVPQMTNTEVLQLSAMGSTYSLLRELCGQDFRPTVVTIASRGPSNLKPLHKHFGAPLRFDSEESALIFEQHWLDRPLPPLDQRVRRSIELEARAQRASAMADLPITVRRLLHRQLLVGECSMEALAASLGIHRRTLDRRLHRYDTSYGELLDSVQEHVACQLLRDTELKVQQIAESLRYSSAANFSTAFRRWTGSTPSEYRRLAAQRDGQHHQERARQQKNGAR